MVTLVFPLLPQCRQCPTFSESSEQEMGEDFSQYSDFTNLLVYLEWELLCAE